MVTVPERARGRSPETRPRSPCAGCATTTCAAASPASDALRTALGPTLQSLADSSIELLDRMLPTEALLVPPRESISRDVRALSAAAV